MTKRVSARILYREHPIAQFCARRRRMLRRMKKKHTEDGFRAACLSRQVKVRQVPPVTAAEYRQVLGKVMFVRAWRREVVTRFQGRLLIFII